MNETHMYLVHHGVEGQSWGKRNGPPYPLDKEGRAEFRRQKKLAKIEKKREKEESKYLTQHNFKSPKDMTDEELVKETNRIKAQTDYTDAINKHIQSEKLYKALTEKGKTTAEKFEEKYGSRIVNSIVDFGTDSGKKLVDAALESAYPGYSAKKKK